MNLTFRIRRSAPGLALQLCILSLVVVNVPAFGQTNCPTAPAGLVAWWPGDGNAADRAGTNHGTLLNGVGYGPGVVGQAFSFNGGYIQCPDSELWHFTTNDFTVELWANWSAVNPGSIGQPGTIFVGSDDGASNQRKWFFAYGGGVLNFHINGPDIGPRFLAQAAFSPVVGDWYHLTATRTALLYHIYVNGMEVSSEYDASSIENARVALTIGQAEGLGYMNGRIDELCIYHRALSSAELLAIYRTASAGKCSLLPVLTIWPAAPLVTLAWPTNALGFVLQSTDNLSPAEWVNAPSGATNPISVPATVPARFYRLVKP